MIIDRFDEAIGELLHFILNIAQARPRLVHRRPSASLLRRAPRCRFARTRTRASFGHLYPGNGTSSFRRSSESSGMGSRMILPFNRRCNADLLIL